MSELIFRSGFELRRRPRIFFCDVDRTLLTQDHVLLPEVAAAMLSLRAIDLPVVLASARSPAGLQRVHGKVGASDTACCFNGAWIGKLSTREGLMEARLGRGQALKAMADIHTAGGSPIWFDLERCYVLAPDEAVGWLRTDVTGDELEVVHSLEQIPGAPFKLLGSFAPDRIRGAVEGLTKVLAGDIAMAQSGPSLVEFVSPLARKDLGASLIARAWGVNTGDVAAAGDSENDAAMLSWAGLAITVANANAQIQELADVVAPSCDVGGLAHALAWLVHKASSASFT